MTKISGISGGVVDGTGKKNKTAKSDEFKKLIDQKIADSEKKTSDTGTGGKAGKIELPADAKKALSETPDVRADKVARIKEQIASGTYNIDPSDVAAAMLKNGFKP
jgi:negative regulator of flagellin synthesis FlgM